MAAVNQSLDAARAVRLSPPGQTRHVLFVTYHFPPSMEMGAQACAQIARYLPLYGWEPAVLTVKERYGEIVGDSLEPEFPGRVVRTGLFPHPLAFYRSLMSGYRSLKSRLHLERKGAGGTGGPSEHMGRLRRWLLSLLLVGDGSTGWLLPASLAGLKVIRGVRVQHLLSSGPPWTGHLVGLLLSRITGLPWTAHFRDPWTQEAQSKPVSVASARIDAALERMIVKQAAFVVCVTVQHTEILRRVYPGFPPGKFITIPNGFDEGEWGRVKTETDVAGPRKETKFTITYSGQLYQARNPQPLFRALRALIDAGDIDRELVQVELIGWCDLAEGRRVADIAEDCGIGDCINIRGPLPRLEALRALTKSSLLLLLAEGLTVQIPGKTYEYLRAGRPILALTAEGALADLLRGTGGAWVVSPGDVAGVAAAVNKTYRHWKEGRPLAGADQVLISNFDRRVLAGQFAELFTRSILPVDAAAIPR
jgi:hypothetical protein